MKFSPQLLGQRLAPHRPFGALLAAYSGGLDSHALLHAAARLAAAEDGGVRLRAVHVHHGLSPDADQWARHCEASCRALGVYLQVVRVAAQPGPGEAPEAAARRARYGALEACAGPGELVLTAHHQDDQAETLLLQLLRGAGPHGLAAMPASRPLGQARLVRPLLEVSRADLAAYASAEGLDWVNDPSNLYLGLRRNYLRHRVLPLLAEGWPEAARILGRAGRLQAGAARILDQVAASDRAGAQGPAPHSLRMARLAGLDRDRQANLVRHFAAALGLPLPAAAHVEQVLATLGTVRPDRAPVVTWPGAEVRRFDGCLWFLRPLAATDPRTEIPWDLSRPLVARHGRLEARPADGEGLSAALLAGRRVRVCWRRGGERCRPVDRRHGQTLKHLFQERAVPPWQRSRLPLVYVDDRLAAVADLWVCTPFGTPAGAPGYRLHWQETSPLPAAAPDAP